MPSGRNGRKATNFVPFVEERNHLGQLIDSDQNKLLRKSKINREAVKTAAERYENKLNNQVRWVDKFALQTDQNLFTTKSGSHAPMSPKSEFEKNQDSQMTNTDSHHFSMNPKKQAYKSLVAAARNMKLPTEDQISTYDKQVTTNVDSFSQKKSKDLNPVQLVTNYNAISKPSCLLGKRNQYGSG